MTNKTLKNLICSLVILATTTPFASYAAAYAPAKFGNAVETLSKQVALPTSFGEGVKTVSVYCQADVTSTGSINAATCYENGPLVSMLKTTESALKSTTFEPATIDGKAVPVKMQYIAVVNYQK